MQVGDLKDLLPTSDGSIRRRLLAGFLVAIGLIPVIWQGDLAGLLDALTRPTVALAALLVSYGIGLVVEIVGETLLARAFGASIWAGEFPLRSVHAETASARWVLRGMAYYAIVPFYAYWNLFRGLVGKSPYVADLSGRLQTNQARELYKGLPEFVQKGLSNPYGDSFESAWVYVIQQLSDAGRAEISRLIVRNKEILAVISSLVLIAVIYLAVADLSSMLNKLFNVRVVDSLRGAVIPIALLVPLVFFAVYHRVLLASIVNCLELCALGDAQRPKSSAAHE